MQQAMQGKFAGKVVVVTGASAGVGRATARQFGEEGAAIGLIASDREALENAKKEIESFGGRALVLPCDVSDDQAVEAAADRVERELGPIDVWVNDAMVSVFAPVKEMSAREYRRVTEVTYLGYVHGTLSALRRMLARDRGVIVQVGSALAYRSIPLQSAYCAAKHAILGFTESLRSELIHDHSNVKVTMVELPVVNAPQFDWVRSRLPHRAQPVPPIYRPEMIAEAITWAALHPSRREYKVGFSTVKALLAEKLVPGFADRYLARHGYETQQAPEGRVPPIPSIRSRRDHLSSPLSGEAGARGFSPESWFSRHPVVTGTAALLLAAFAWSLASLRGMPERRI